MGCFYLADMVTGLVIENRDPVIAFVVARRTGGYPDAQSAAARPGIACGHLFQAVSLPISGIYDDYGRIKPDPDQLAVRLVCEMTGTKNWMEFEEKAFDFRHGIRFQTRSLMATIGNESEHDESPIVLGLSVMHRETWNLLMSLDSRGAHRDLDVDNTKDLLRDAIDRLRQQDLDGHHMRLTATVDLSLAGMYKFNNGLEVDPPALAQSLSTLESDGFFGRKFIEWLQGSRYIGFRLSGNPNGLEDAPWIDDLLNGLWEAQACRIGLECLNRLIVPSPAVGQHANSQAILSLAASLIQQASGKMINKVRGDGDASGGLALREYLESISEMKDVIREDLDEGIESSDEETEDFDEDL